MLRRNLKLKLFFNFKGLIILWLCFLFVALSEIFRTLCNEVYYEIKFSNTFTQFMYTLSCYRNAGLIIRLEVSMLLSSKTIFILNEKGKQICVDFLFESFITRKSKEEEKRNFYSLGIHVCISNIEKSRTPFPALCFWANFSRFL